MIIWLTGIPCSGKTTIAEYMTRGSDNEDSVMLDGDEFRHTLCSDLGFSPEDRLTNMLRIAHVANMFDKHFLFVFVAAIAPTNSIRSMIKMTCPNVKFVYVKCPVEIAAKRDVKGMYAEKGIEEMTGMYIPPVEPDLIVETDVMSVEDCVNKIWEITA